MTFAAIFSALLIPSNRKIGAVCSDNGGDHTVLKAWKAEHVADAVNSWFQ